MSSTPNLHALVNAEPCEGMGRIMAQGEYVALKERVRELEALAQEYLAYLVGYCESADEDDPSFIHLERCRRALSNGGGGGE